MDETGESPTQPADTEGQPPSVEETRTDTEVNVEITSDGSLERPREERVEEENPEQPSDSPAETEEAVAAGDERGQEREAAPAVAEGQRERENEGTRAENNEGAQQEEEKEERAEKTAVEEEREEREGGREEGEEERTAVEEGEGGRTVVEEGERGRKEEEEGGEDTQTQQTSSQSESTPKETKKQEKERKKADKKSKKKSRHTREETTPNSPPKQRKRHSEGHGREEGGRQMEEILITTFQPFDPYGSGSVEASTFWEILQSADLNLQLGPQDLTALQQVVPTDRSGHIQYAEFAAQANDVIMSLYQEKPPSEDYHVRMATPSGNRVLSYDKQTGQFQDLVEGGVDPFGENIRNLFQSIDTEGRGHITREEFMTLFQVEHLQQLNEEDHSQMMQYYDEAIPGGQAGYEEFYPLGRELILRLYRNQDTSDSDWINLHSEQLGHYQLNKFTGEIHRDPAPQALQVSTTHPQMDLVNQAYLQVEEVTFEKEQYKQENKDLQNQLLQTREDQETLAAQLDQTGHVLDEANLEIRHKEEEAAELQAVLAGKEHEIEDLKAQITEAAVVRERLHMLEQELEAAQGEVEERDQGMVTKDSNITTLKRQSLGVVDKLKTAWATIDARDSTIAKLQHQLKTEQNRTKTYEEQTPILESKVAELVGEMKRLNQSLEEKTSTLTSTRKQLKNTRERNLELEKVAEKVAVSQDKLQGAEAEIRTLKGLLTSKTAMVERRKKELAETRTRLLDLEEKDSRRAIILADVLERTAREYQHSLQVGGAATFDPLSTSQYMEPIGRRPVSAPSIPPEQVNPPPHPHTITEGTPHTLTHPHKVVRTYTMPLGGKRANTRPVHRELSHFHTIPKLPPIQKRVTRRSSFHVPTEREVEEQQRQRDRETVQHSESNPHCACQLCMGGGATEETMGNGVRLEEQVSLAGLSGSQDRTLSRQLNTGQRVLVTMKRSEYDLEPQQYTGIVKYVGKIDSEFIDNRVYVGVKLDEPVGDTDGLIKGKRYFHCPPKHGKVVRLSSILAVLPRRSVSYKPLQVSRGNPYSSAPPSHKRSRLKVT